jgi:GMP synthase (glutamine-hydrolysing)
MHVLAVIHGESVRPGVFGETVVDRGHRLEEWSLAWGAPPPRPVDDYGAVVVFGGAMHADQDDRHPWLREENLFLQRLLDLRVPLFGVCLGAQLIAKASHAPVLLAPEPEIGWVPVELTAAGREDPVLGRLPERFDAFEWHYYTYGVPAGASELAASRRCPQAFRLGEAAWGIQFHAEVTLDYISAWIEDTDEPVAGLLDESKQRIEAWNELGRELCGAFCDMAERHAVTTAK